MCRIYDVQDWHCLLVSESHLHDRDDYSSSIGTKCPARSVSKSRKKVLLPEARLSRR